MARSFGQASSYIYINKDHVQDAVLWLQKHQLSNGCFQSVGKLFNNDLKVWLMAMEVGMGETQYGDGVTSPGSSDVHSSTKYGLTQPNIFPEQNEA